MKAKEIYGWDKLHVKVHCNVTLTKLANIITERNLYCEIGGIFDGFAGYSVNLVQYVVAQLQFSMDVYEGYMRKDWIIDSNHFSRLTEIVERAMAEYPDYYSVADQRNWNWWKDHYIEFLKKCKA